MKEDSLLKALMEVASTVIYVEEVTSDASITKEVYDYANTCTEKFFEQVDAKLKNASNEEERQFVVDGTFNFLLFSMIRMTKDIDDENVERLANHVRDKLLDQIGRK